MSAPTSLLAATLGWAAGMRSMTPPAVLAHALGSRTLANRLLTRRRPQPARTLGTDRAAALLTVAAAGELVVDKLPMAPPRTQAPALAGRVATGALAGAALAAARRQSPVGPAVVGAVGAFVSSFVMMEARREIGERFDVPDPAVAVVEDVLAIGLSVAATRDLGG